LSTKFGLDHKIHLVAKFGYDNQKLSKVQNLPNLLVDITKFLMNSTKHFKACSLMLSDRVESLARREEKLTDKNRNDSILHLHKTKSTIST